MNTYFDLALKSNRLLHRGIMLLLALLIIVANLNYAEAQSGNLVTNPGFEANGASQTPTGWSEWSSAAHLDASFSEAGGHTGSFRGAHWKASAYDVYTSQTKTGLTNGLYTLRAWVKSSGGQTMAVMNVKNYGGATIDAAIPTTGTWTQITTANINITNGQATFGFYSVAGANQWINFDDVEFFLQGSATATPTRTNTPTSTLTRTNTPVPPTNTPTRTNTPVPPTATPSGGCGTTNVALNKPATSSSNESASYPPSQAVDSNTGTRWASAMSDPQWIYVDLGSTQTICRVKLNWEVAYGKSYQIQTSGDATNWTNIYSTTTGDGGIDDLTGLSGSGRYVRMYGTVRGTQWGYSLWEFEIYTGSGGPTPTPNPNPTPLGIPGTWTLKFADEFSGTSLNTADWTPNWLGSCCTQITPPVNTSEDAAYDPAQVTVSGGTLRFALISSPITIGSKTYPYRSGMIQSNGKHQFTFGAFEARLYFPASGTSIANWPAWWTDGQNWPTDGEMDIVEGLSGSAAYHFHSDTTGAGANVPGNYTGWHTYGSNWQSGIVKFYYDGVLVGTLNSGITSSPMYLILNYATGGCCAGPVVAPATMQVDYVRVWQ